MTVTLQSAVSVLIEAEQLTISEMKLRSIGHNQTYYPINSKNYLLSCKEAKLTLFALRFFQLPE